MWHFDFIDAIMYTIGVLGTLAVFSGALLAFLTLVTDGDHHIEGEL